MAFSPYNAGGYGGGIGGGVRATSPTPTTPGTWSPPTGPAAAYSGGPSAAPPPPPPQTSYVNPYGGQQQGGGYTGGYPGAGGATSSGGGDDYNKALMAQTGLGLPVSIDDPTRQNLLAQQGGLAGQFADRSQNGYNAYGQQGQQALDYYRGVMSGQNSVSAEQLRQGLGQMYGQQMSAAASASPRNAAMAARMAMTNMGRAGMGMAGQQAVAGLQERNQAYGAYGNLLGNLRGQDLNAALSSRQAAESGYGAGMTGPPQPTFWQQYGPAISAGALAAATAFSDRALKTGIRSGDAAANAAIGTLGRPSNPFAAPAPAPQSIVPMSVAALPASQKAGLDTFYQQVGGSVDPTAPDPNAAGLDGFYGQIAGATPATGAGAGAGATADASVPWWKRLAGGLALGLRTFPQAYAQYPYSDRALKTNIKSADDRANAAIAGIQPITYQYKKGVIGPDGQPLDLGDGPQFGIAAQDLLAAGLPHTVVNVPGVGLAIDAGKLSTTNTGLIAALGKRVAALEGQKGKAFTYDPLAPDIDREVDAQAYGNANRLDREAAARRAKQDPAAAAAQAQLQRRREILAAPPVAPPSSPPLPSWAMQTPPMPSWAAPSPPLPSWAYAPR